MDRQVAVRDTAQTAALWEQVLAVGDLAKLSSAQRVDWILRICESEKLNPATRPFEFITLNGRLVLYARKDCTEQLRRRDGISVVDVKEHTTEGIHIVWATLRNAEGREDRDMGAVNVKGLTGDALANAYMKAITKAKRRATLSICGLGFLDETELETIPAAQAQAEPYFKQQLPVPTRPTTAPKPAPKPIDAVFGVEPEVVEGEVVDENAIPPEVREAGPELVDAFVTVRKSLRGAATLDALKVEWSAATQYLSSLGAPKRVGDAAAAIKEARKAELTGQIAAF